MDCYMDFGVLLRVIPCSIEGKVVRITIQCKFEQLNILWGLSYCAVTCNATKVTA